VDKSRICFGESWGMAIKTPPQRNERSFRAMNHQFGAFDWKPILKPGADVLI